DINTKKILQKKTTIFVSEDTGYARSPRICNLSNMFAVKQLPMTDASELHISDGQL
ncbi:hypothetical protein L9F63_011337, partial [Diploptera punctata]